MVGYQQIAAGYRRSLPLKVIAITGSNGKTSTKDFVAAALGHRFRVTKTQGNFNNHVGLPRTILDATSEDEIAVWELGMNHPGEIAALAALAAPDVGIITNIGVAHIEFMGSREAIAQEKGALAEAIGADGTMILNADDAFTESIARRTRGKDHSRRRPERRGARRRYSSKRQRLGVHDPGRRAPVPRATAGARFAHGAECACSRSRLDALSACRSKNAQPVSPQRR